jgi:hypothetical protein
VGVKQKDDEADFDGGSPGFALHVTVALPIAFTKAISNYDGWATLEA